MADEISTEVAETTVPEVEETSTNSDDILKGLLDTEETGAETETEEESEDVSEETSEDETETEETEETEEQEESTDIESTDPKELARQAFQRRQEERKARESRAKAEQDKYIAEAEDEKDEALRLLQVEAYNNRVDRVTNQLTSGFDRAISKLDVFQNPTPAIQSMLNDAIDEFEARHVSIDVNGNPVSVNGDIEQFLSKKADIIRELTQTGARQEKVASAKSSAAVIPPPASTPKAPKKDPVMEGLMS